MHWIVQSNLYNEKTYHVLISTLDKLGVKYTSVKVVPFGHTLEPEPIIDPGELVYVCGATTLVGISKERGWHPGAFHSDNLDYQIWSQKYKGMILNEDGIICKFGDALSVDWDPFFIKPTADTKSFSGQVMSRSDFISWRQLAIDATDGYTTLTLDTPIVISPVIDIWREYRFFVVGGKIVTGSLYKSNDRLDISAIIDTAALDFAQSVVDIWCPEDAFVLDIADIENGFRVIEVNCINASGFYACEIDKIVDAIDTMYP